MPSRVALLAVVSLVGAAVMAGSSGAAAATAVWPMYHLDQGRSGNDSSEPSFSNLRSSWNSGALDGAMYAEPLVDGNLVIVATENNSLYAFNATTGSLQWGPTNLGTPRTSNFPCGDINPLGITGTPVIDGGFLYAVADVQTSLTTFEFHLARVDPSSGAVSYNVNITPSGMDPNVEQERSALAVSAGNVVVVWGGLDGDCGTYHGFIETVAETSGAAQHQWNDTSETGGREGGMWAPSGPAVDSSGNIYVSTGNGSSTSITTYDYGDSVLKFSSALGLLSFFATGPPNTWASLNASDTDLGSMGPSLLPSGLLFAIGKGGRGYLLNQSALPNNFNPGGGENASLAVCHASSSAAFGGLAVSGNVVFVPCADGIAAVSIDSATAFHTLWYTTAGGGSAPIVAGGLVWTLKMFGGTNLYGLQPGTGQITASLTLPAATEHFATPAAGDGMLFVGAGNRLAAFAPNIQPTPFTPKNVGAPSATVAADGTQLIFWEGAGGHLVEAWWKGFWNGPVDWTAANRWSPSLTSAPSVTVGSDGTQLIFWRGPGNHLFEAWWQGKWNGPVDWTAANGWSPSVISAPSVKIAPDGTQLIFWQGAGGHLMEAWWQGRWNGPVDWTVANRWSPSLTSAPNVALAADGTQLIFWQGAGGHLFEAWWQGRWNGPVDWTAANRWSPSLTSAPSAAIMTNGTQLIFWQGAGGQLFEVWWQGKWNGPVDWTAANSWAPSLTSAPSVTLASDGTQLIFWQGSGAHLFEVWWQGRWNGPVDWSS